MTSPPTFDEVRALCQRVADGDADAAQVLEMLDADYFAGCDVLDLDPEHVETIVRWAIRETLKSWVWSGIAIGAFLPDDDDAVAFAHSVSGGPVDQGSRLQQKDIVRQSMAAVMDQLREVNGQEEDQ